MAKRRLKPAARVDTSGSRSTLTDNPFVSLVGNSSIGARAHSQPDGPSNAAMPPEFSVSRTRKGGVSVRTEKRPGGRVVTIVDNVSGDADALLALLKRRCASGGVVREGKVEIQGDHRDRVEELLRTTDAH